ncbi:MAG: hypothetical protein ACOYMH_06970 [Zwartia sp.]|jgi:hypothetical protein
METMDEASRKSYPTIYLLVRFGSGLAAGLVLLTVVALVWYGWLNGLAPVLWWLASVYLIALYILARSYVELVRVLADMLLPK